MSRFLVGVVQLCFFVVPQGFLGPAYASHLIAWRAIDGVPPFVINARDGEAPAAAAIRYVTSLRADAEMMKVFAGHLPSFKPSEFAPVPDLNSKSALLIANHADDYKAVTGWRVDVYLPFLKAANVSPFLLPVGHDVGLSGSEAAEYREELYTHFRFVIGMGGADVDPRFYNEVNTDSRDLNGPRDSAELRFLDGYFKALQKGVYIGICRGAQLAAVALKYKLIQDIPKLVGTKVRHDDGAVHDIRLLPASSSWIRTFMGGKETLRVNSWHHQAVDLVSNPQGPLIATASSEDGVNEAFQSRDGRILLLQFHPELMSWIRDLAELGRRMMFALIATGVQP